MNPQQPKPSINITQSSPIISTSTQPRTQLQFGMSGLSHNNNSNNNNSNNSQSQSQSSNEVALNSSENIKQYYNQLVSNYKIIQQQLQQLSSLPSSPQVIERKKFLLEQHELLQNAMQDLTNRFNQQKQSYQQQQPQQQQPQLLTQHHQNKDINRATSLNTMLPSSNISPPSPLIQLSNGNIPSTPKQQQQQPLNSHSQTPKNNTSLAKQGTIPSPSPQQSQPKISFPIKEFLQRNRITGSCLVGPPSSTSIPLISSSSKSSSIENNRIQLKNSLFKQLRGGKGGDGKMIYSMTRKSCDDLIIAPSGMKEIFQIADRWVTEITKEIAINAFHRSPFATSITWEDIDLALCNNGNNNNNNNNNNVQTKRKLYPTTLHVSSDSLPSSSSSSPNQTTNNAHRTRLLQVRKIIDKS